MDPESIGKETIVKVTDWLRGMWEMRRRNSPVQQWVDSIPLPLKSNLPVTIDVKPSTSATPTPAKDIPLLKGNYSKIPTMTVSAPINVPSTPAINNMCRIPSSLPHARLARDQSFQSDSSHCSSIESLLELRKADPEAVLFSLGFGGCSNSPQESGPLSRIPKRFLQPSKLKGIAINDFVKQQQETSESFDSVSLGYRGLTGSPYVAPSEIVQKIMERLREHESHEMDACAIYNAYEQSNKMYPQPKHSVLSPDNRQFLEQPRSKSPDMRNKRMIIGQKSFAFGHNGDLIEICLPNTKEISHKKEDNYCTISDISKLRELKGIHMKTEKSSIKKLDDESIKRKLLDEFNGSTESYETDESLLQPSNYFNDQINVNMKCKVEDKEKSKSTATITENDDKIPFKYVGIRRASEGFDEVNLGENNFIPDGRRFSDSIIIKNQINEGLLNRRKSLKRQARVNEFDVDNFYSSSPIVFKDKIVQDKKSESDLTPDLYATSKKITNIQEINLESTQEVECLSKEKVNETYGPFKSYKYAPSISTNTSSTSLSTTSVLKPTKGTKCCKKKNQVCDCKEKLDTIYKAEDMHGECYCQFDDNKCWEKVEKIMQENKKLEDIVAKSRIEMAEIRDMLNSVLSVRMEPGF
ncbi:PREDICTED: uncharacterized protein LOC106784689 isoform X1 [Polistes canadensis]|uniref:uncharacterized protein LOC106784689 isoform X1 n=2 Tax=Polistes canadensis TaxID=91411 RepID=UPI000718B8FA|nr:PREDICTED: uncharacterized protein LOC106784689 isoform X1 [Polistes canadensis]